MLNFETDGQTLTLKGGWTSLNAATNILFAGSKAATGTLILDGGTYVMNGGGSVYGFNLGKFNDTTSSAGTVLKSGTIQAKNGKYFIIGASSGTGVFRQEGGLIDIAGNNAANGIVVGWSGNTASGQYIMNGGVIQQASDCQQYYHWR